MLPTSQMRALLSSEAVTSRLPELIPHLPEIVSFLALYYGVPDAPALGGLSG